VIEVVGISKRFGTVPALNGLSFTVPEGKIFGLIGPNGAGKTTTIRILSALVRPDAGTVFLNGVGLKSPTQIRRMIGALIEQPGLYTRLTVCEFLHFFARLYDLPARSAHARIEELLELLEIEEFQDERLAGFSMGMKQKISLARILLHDPPIPSCCWMSLLLVLIR
jgi:ABC-2 type transport system ATP-binding protein